MLTLLAYVYGKVTTLRNALYDRGVFEVHDLGARTISIGNLTTGGTGKTPLVAYVAEILAKRGETLCILTRGYGRSDPKNRVLVSDGETVLADATTGGDEPVELANKLIGKAIVIADADRVAAAEWAKRKFGITAFVLDDGFQHRKVKRDVDIVCIDATQALADAKMLPTGRLREQLSGLSRADAIVITRADLVDAEIISKLRREILVWDPGIAIFEATNKLKKKTVRGSVFAFCGLGNPDNFFEMLRRAKTDVAGTRAFKDHHIYSQDDVTLVEKTARSVGARSLVTTAKDAVKLERVTFEMPLAVAEVEVVLDDAPAFAKLL